MQHIQVTLVGVVVSEVFHIDDGGHEMSSFRMVSRPRRFDASSGRAFEGEPSFVSVVTRRALAAHVAASVTRGDPVVVTGRLRVREREIDGQIKVRVEVEAHTLGHDLGRGTSVFTRATRRATPAHAATYSADRGVGSSGNDREVTQAGEQRTVA